MQRLTFFSLLILVCSCMASQTRMQKLQNAVTEFNDGLRWGRMGQVITKLDAEIKASFIEDHSEFGKTIKITNCEVVSIDITEEQDKSDVGIKISWYSINHMEVLETVILQKWELKDHKWFLMSEEHKKGATLY